MSERWKSYGYCKRCDAMTGQPCLSMRGVPRGWTPNRSVPAIVRSREMRKPHPGRARLKAETTT